MIPIRLRCLFDHAHILILRHLEFDTWETLRGEKSLYELTDTLFTELASPPHCPSKKSIALVCAYNNVRQPGDTAPHTVDEEQQREAVMTTPIDSTGRKLAEELFRFVFDSDIV